MDYKDIVWKYPRYKIDKAYLIVGQNDPFEIKQNVVQNMLIKKDYENELFPYFEIMIMVPYWVYDNIIKTPNEVFMTLDLHYGMYDSVLDPGIPTTSDLKGKFKCIFEDVSPSIEGKWQLIREQEEGVRNERYGGNDLMPLQMLLYNAGYMESYEKVLDKMLTSTTLTNALTYTLKYNGISNVLMSPPDNRKTYSEFRITPIPAKEQLYRICNEYCLYRDGATIYFDLDYCYILSKAPKCDAWKPNEWKTTHAICLQEFHQSSVSSGGHYKDSKEKANVLNILTDSIMDAAGNNAKEKSFNMINTATGQVDKVGSGTPTSTYVYDTADDAGSIITAMSRERMKAFGCQFNHCILSALNPNKLFVVTVDDPNLKHLCGEYRIVKWMCQFEREGNFWNPQVTAEFRSCKS